MKSKRAREAAEPEGKHVDPVEVEAPPKKRKRTGEDDSTDLKKVKKDKKERKDKKDKKHKKESRKERKEKRKDLQDLPEQDDQVDDESAPATNGGVAEDSPMVDAASQPAAAPADAADSEKSAKRDKKKKEKKEKLKRALENTDAAANGDAENQPTTSDSKKKKEKKSKKASHDESTATSTDAGADGHANSDADADADAEDSAKKADRHIVFVGNLPFTATADTIEAHFSSLSPASVRCMSDPNSDKPCRGFAFVEFSKVWHMRTCLDKFHHSMFNDEISAPRRINVELTAGGGGKTKQRQEKIKEKNRKLDENRTKRIEREKNTKEENRANGNSTTQQHMEDSIHPSRRARVPGDY